MVVNVLVQIGRQHIMEACLHKLELIDATFSTWRVETDAQKVGATDDGANLDSLVELGLGFLGRQDVALLLWRDQHSPHDSNQSVSKGCL